METTQQLAVKGSTQTPSGRIAYLEQGQGPVALFVHGVLLNSHLWRHQLAHLSDMRRCIAVDLLAHGDTEITPDQDISVTANARMLAEFLDALSIDQVDLVGNDSGGGIAQIFAASYPHRLLSSPSWPWLLPVGCHERSKRCWRTRMFTGRERRSAWPTSILSE